MLEQGFDDLDLSRGGLAVTGGQDDCLEPGVRFVDRFAKGLEVVKV